FFSSRRRHTRFDCDWSSDVCSSDLDVPGPHLGDDAVDAHGAAAGQLPFGGNDVVELQVAIVTDPDPELQRGGVLGADDPAGGVEIGRASCRERVEIWGGGVWWREES